MAKFATEKFQRMFRILLILTLPIFILSFREEADTIEKNVVTSSFSSQRDDTLIVDDMIFADFFSPNGDGFNDTYVILNVENWPGNSLKVFNRWGEVVYLAEPYKNDWDGTNNRGGALLGSKLSDGVYFFEFYNGKGNISSGKITLKR